MMSETLLERMDETALETLSDEHTQVHAGSSFSNMNI